MPYLKGIAPNPSSSGGELQRVNEQHFGSESVREGETKDAMDGGYLGFSVTFELADDAVPLELLARVRFLTGFTGFG